MRAAVVPITVARRRELRTPFPWARVASPDDESDVLFSAAPPLPIPLALEKRCWRNSLAPELRRILREQGPNGASVGDDGKLPARIASDLGSNESTDPGPKLSQALPVRGPRRPGVQHPSVETTFVLAPARLRRTTIPAAEIEFPELWASEDFGAGRENSGRLPAPREVARYDDIGPESLEARTESKDLSAPPRRQRRVPVAGVASGPS